jgi:hypothetical protein
LKIDRSDKCMERSVKEYWNLSNEVSDEYNSEVGLPVYALELDRSSAKQNLNSAKQTISHSNLNSFEP